VQLYVWWERATLVSNCCAILYALFARLADRQRPQRLGGSGGRPAGVRDRTCRPGPAALSVSSARPQRRRRRLGPVGRRRSTPTMTTKTMMIRLSNDGLVRVERLNERCVAKPSDWTKALRCRIVTVRQTGAPNGRRNDNRFVSRSVVSLISRQKSQHRCFYYGILWRLPRTYILLCGPVPTACIYVVDAMAILSVRPPVRHTDS